MIDSTGVQAPSHLRPPHGLRQATRAAAADALGMTPQDFAAQLRSGLSMEDVAQEHGVSRETLVAAVAGAVQSVASGASDPTAMAQKIVDHENGPEGRHLHRGLGGVAL